MRHQLFDLTGLLRRQPRHNILEVRVRIKAVHARRLDQAHDHRSRLQAFLHDLGFEGLGVRASLAHGNPDDKSDRVRKNRRTTLPLMLASGSYVHRALTVIVSKASIQIRLPHSLFTDGLLIVLCKLVALGCHA